MPDLSARIDQLGGQELRQALDFLARAMLDDGDYITQWDRDLRGALAEAADAPTPLPKATEDEVARAALKLAAESPELRHRLEVCLEGPAPGKFLTGGELALITAVLVILQTEVGIKRNTSGKWSVTIKKKALGDGALKALINKLSGLF